MLELRQIVKNKFVPTNNLKIQIPASSSNLGAGFDCFGLALDIFNEYEIEFTESDGEFIFESNLDESICSSDKNNLFYTSYVHLLDKAAHTSKAGLKVKLKAQIPSSGGFGSSGTAVVAGLMTANKGWP